MRSENSGSAFPSVQQFSVGRCGETDGCCGEFGNGSGKADGCCGEFGNGSGKADGSCGEFGNGSGKADGSCGNSHSSGCWLSVDDSVESIDMVCSVFNSALGAIGFYEAVATVNDVSVTGLMGALLVSSVVVGYSVGIFVLWVGMVVDNGSLGGNGNWCGDCDGCGKLGNGGGSEVTSISDGHEGGEGEDLRNRNQIFCHKIWRRKLKEDLTDYKPVVG
ncbi:hypothetical protein J437_LFUL013712 [Ladona fulva]|uniref:Uncharacterized protein n=1 Tax=Ladona fulva TaxID=123851 RepID=A0A8K0KGP4_LADFU|nr:hypothetical protein J437_LFUL013712 [Ladona fulva]